MAASITEEIRDMTFFQSANHILNLAKTKGLNLDKFDIVITFIGRVYTLTKGVLEDLKYNPGVVDLVLSGVFPIAKEMMKIVEEHFKDELERIAALLGTILSMIKGVVSSVLEPAGMKTGNLYDAITESVKSLIDTWKTREWMEAAITIGAAALGTALALAFGPGGWFTLSVAALFGSTAYLTFELVCPSPDKIEELSKMSIKGSVDVKALSNSISRGVVGV